MAGKNQLPSTIRLENGKITASQGLCQTNLAYARTAITNTRASASHVQRGAFLVMRQESQNAAPARAAISTTAQYRSAMTRRLWQGLSGRRRFVASQCTFLLRSYEEIMRNARLLLILRR